MKKFPSSPPPKPARTISHRHQAPTATSSGNSRTMIGRSKSYATPPAPLGGGRKGGAGSTSNKKLQQLVPPTLVERQQKPSSSALYHHSNKNKNNNPFAQQHQQQSQTALLLRGFLLGMGAMMLVIVCCCMPLFFFWSSSPSTTPTPTTTHPFQKVQQAPTSSASRRVDVVAALNKDEVDNNNHQQINHQDHEEKPSGKNNYEATSSSIKKQQVNNNNVIIQPADTEEEVDAGYGHHHPGIDVVIEEEELHILREEGQPATAISENNKQSSSSFLRSSNNNSPSITQNYHQKDDDKKDNNEALLTRPLPSANDDEPSPPAQQDQKNNNKFAYVYVVGGIDFENPTYRNFLYTILINTENMRNTGSQSDVVIFVQMNNSNNDSDDQVSLPASDIDMLHEMNIKVQYIPPPPASASDGSGNSEITFESLMMEKFRILQLKEYDRVMYVDADILLRHHLDYIMELSISGVLKENVVFAARYVPAAGSLFVLTPGHFLQLWSIRKEGFANKNIDIGWGHPFDHHDRYEFVNGRSGTRWDFVDADKDQGLLYHWTKYDRQNVSIIRKKDIQNWGSDEKGALQLQDTLSLSIFDNQLGGGGGADESSSSSSSYTCWKEYMGHRPCRPPHRDFTHHPGSKKMWLKPPPTDFLDNPMSSPSHYWFHALHHLNQKLDLSIDLENWARNQRPVLGYHPANAVSRPKSDGPTSSDFAYAYVVGGVDPNQPAYRNFIYSILVNTHLQRQDGSRADVLVYFQMSYDSPYEELPDADVQLLKKSNVHIMYIDKSADESFERLMFDKFRILQLTDYKRIMYLDADMLIRGSMDYLFKLSMDGSIRENVVLAGRLEPAIGGLFMLAPKLGDWERLLDIVQEKEERGEHLPSPYFDEKIGWGQPFGEDDGYELLRGKQDSGLWDFKGAPTDQGLLYHWVKYEKKDVSIVMKETVQNWSMGSNGNVHLTTTASIYDLFESLASPRKCWKELLSHKPCTAPHADYIHFVGHKKPFLKGPPVDLMEQNEDTSPSHIWFRTLMTLNDNLQLGLNFQEWKNHITPLLGVRSNTLELVGTTYADSASKKFLSPYTVPRNQTGFARFAYVYVVGGCKPADPSYRNYLNNIFVSTYLQREQGSKADVVVLIQMAFESSHDILPETDRKLLKAMDIKAEYIPKAHDESFYRIMLDKFRILNLDHQYERVLLMDADVMARGSLDYLFDLSVQGVLKENLVIASGTEPANGGFFMLTPKQDSWERIMRIIKEKEERGAKLPYPHWDETLGWGHALDESEYFELAKRGEKGKKWDFHGAFADQGLLYHWVKYEEKTVSIVIIGTIQNWEADKNGIVRLASKMPSKDVLPGERPCWKMTMCQPLLWDFHHFTGRSKPWLDGVPDDFQEVPATTTAKHYWFHILSILNAKMQMGLDFQNWKTHQRPLLGTYPKHEHAATTRYASGI